MALEAAITNMSYNQHLRNNLEGQPYQSNSFIVIYKLLKMVTHSTPNQLMNDFRGHNFSISEHI